MIEKRKPTYQEIIKLCNKKDEEIERLNKQIEEYQKALDETTSKKIDLENIIKEVREYIEDWQKFPHTNGSTHKELKNLIEILDKENI